MENGYGIGIDAIPAQGCALKKTKRGEMQMPIWMARIGAAVYVLWGLFHVIAARAVYGLAGTTTGMVQGRLQQDAFYLLFFAIAGIAIAALLNWRNDRQGYWMNGLLIAIADIPFILFVLVPGYMPWWPGLIGPLLWAVAFGLTTIARFGSSAPNLSQARA